jgi:hypothetical protein
MFEATTASVSPSRREGWLGLGRVGSATFRGVVVSAGKNRARLALSAKGSTANCPAPPPFQSADSGSLPWPGSWPELQAPGALGVHGVPRWRCGCAQVGWVCSGAPVSGAFVMRGSGVRFPEAAPPSSPAFPGIVAVLWSGSNLARGSKDQVGAARCARARPASQAAPAEPDASHTWRSSVGRVGLRAGRSAGASRHT